MGILLNLYSMEVYCDFMNSTIVGSYVGGAVGSLVCPGLGTIVGIGVGFGVGWAYDKLFTPFKKDIQDALS